MSLVKRRIFPAVVAGVVGLGALATFAGEPTTQPTPQDLAAEVQELKAQVVKLQANQAQTQADISSTIQQVIKDADDHSKFLDTGSDAITSGYANKRFFIQSEDGNFVIRPWIHMQFRYSTSYRNDVRDTGTESDTESGFEMRRARLGFDGNLFTKDLTYFINWATYRGQGTGQTGSDGTPVLEEAWLKYNFNDTPYYIKAGQMHDPLDHENIVGSKYRAPEASLQGDIFGNTDTFTQAVTFIYDNKQAIRFEGGVTDGIRSANTNFEDAQNAGVVYDGGLAGRVEYKVMGNWKDYDQLTSLNDKEPLLVFGSGMDYSYGGDFYSICNTLDVQYADPHGWFAYLCYFGRYTENNPGLPNGAPVSTAFSVPGNPGKDTYEPSFDAQLAYLIDGHLEPFVRYEYMDLAGTPAGSKNNVTDISLGANYYFYGHNVKFTVQGTYLPSGIPVNDTSADVLISNNKAEIVLITQIQLLL